MHGGRGNGRPGNATQEKRKGLKQNCSCLCIVKTGEMPSSRNSDWGCPWPQLFRLGTKFSDQITKHSSPVVRLYGCSRLPGCSWRDSEKPRGGSRRVVTRSLSGR